MSELDAAVLNWSDLGVNELVPTGTVTLLLADVEGSTPPPVERGAGSREPLGNQEASTP